MNIAGNNYKMHTTSLELRSLDRTESKLNITGSNVINGIPPISSPEGHDKDFVDIFAVKPAREMDDYDVDFRWVTQSSPFSKLVSNDFQRYSKICS